jgi:UDP:flavonoid glycosyltransferase YjiC (YdhE family)
VRALVVSVDIPGHVFPAIALARELRARGHEVLVQTTERWRNTVEGLELRFAVTDHSTLLPGMAADGRWVSGLSDAARSLVPLMREFGPDIVVSDVFTTPPALAAETAGLPRATLMPIPYPPRGPGLPDSELGLLPPRTLVGRHMWRAIGPLLERRLPRTQWLSGAEQGLNAARARLGLSALVRSDGAVTEGLTMVATLPQLEYPRVWPDDVHVTGPMIFDPPHPDVKLPEGEAPLVVAVSSTERDPDLRLLGVALKALEREPVRIVAATGRRGGMWSDRVPENAVVTDWVSYAQVMPRASLLVGQGGQGTLARALSEGVPALVCPDAPDMAGNGARVAWGGAGLMLPRRMLKPGPLRWAARQLLGDRRFLMRAKEIAAWSRENDGAALGAALVERYARRGEGGSR